MLRQLNQEEIALYWQFIRDELNNLHYIKYTEAELTSIQTSLLFGQLVCWVLFDDKNDLIGFTITAVISELGTGERMLLIYHNVHKSSFIEEFDIEAYRNNFELVKNNLLDYCKELGIKKVVTYTMSPRARRLYTELGASTMFYLTWEV